MSRLHEEPKIYKHQQLMDDFNDLQIRIKAHLLDIVDSELKQRHSKPTNDELNVMSNKIMSALKENNEPMRKH